MEPLWTDAFILPPTYRYSVGDQSQAARGHRDASSQTEAAAGGLFPQVEFN
jgi:hypothetical protein